MLKAKLDSVRKNKKGFSLVELIIVVAIMVALIAVLAPAYVKYVKSSRDAALQSAAEDVYTALKAEMIDPNSTVSARSGSVTVTNRDSKLAVTFSEDFGTADQTTLKALIQNDANKTMKPGDVDTYIITVTNGVVTMGTATFVGPTSSDS